jgi:two-component system cell cycle response regulator CpdR
LISHEVGNVRILLADDDAATLNFVKRALQGEGHDVTVAEDGNAALDILTAQGSKFALLIADVDMPGLNGIALCQRAVTIDGAMPILLMSAHHTELARATGLGSARYEFILKPFALEDIRAAVKRLTPDS